MAGCPRTTFASSAFAFLLPFSADAVAWLDCILACAIAFGRARHARLINKCSLIALKKLLLDIVFYYECRSLICLVKVFLLQFVFKYRLTNSVKDAHPIMSYVEAFR